ncbi:MAG: hypothetical protein ABI867_43330 [Kofleriaceae bacterium]
MFKLAAIAVIALVGCSSSSPSSAVIGAPIVETAALAESSPTPIEIPEELTLDSAAAGTRCRCATYSFAMSPCNQTQCANICYHATRKPGGCF